MPTLKPESGIQQHLNEAAEAIRIANDSAKQQQQQQLQQLRSSQHQTHPSVTSQQQQQLQNIQQSHGPQSQNDTMSHLGHVHTQHHQQQAQSHGSRNGSFETGFPQLNDLDLKTKDSKYKRWSPRMDQYLVKLLSDVVHSYHKGAEPKMTKKAWSYVTGKLRSVNPETVYSTYTKYSCQQHLIHVIHHRYKIWYSLMTHQKHHPSTNGYTYKWNPSQGKFQIFEQNTGALMDDDRQIKSLLYSEGLSLPSYNNLNKGPLIINEYFFTDHLRYMSLYHNEVIQLLMGLDSVFQRGLENVYQDIPRFDYPEQNDDWYRPLIPAKARKATDSSLSSHSESKKRSHSDLVSSAAKNSHHHSSGQDLQSLPPSANDVQVFLTHDNGSDRSGDLPPPDDSVDPLLKRSRNTPDASVSSVADFENAIANAAIAAIDSPTVSNGRDPPVYFKERKWFNKLMALYNANHISSEEVLTVCEGVRDGKIPLFMLNVLDSTYYAVRNGETQEVDNVDAEDDDEVVRKLRSIMLPMTYRS